MLASSGSTDNVFEMSWIRRQLDSTHEVSKQETSTMDADIRRTLSSNIGAKNYLSRSESDESLPPLDNVTSESFSSQSTDDDSSVSTMESTISSSSRRFMFAKYWNATGQCPPSTIRKRTASTGQPCRRSIMFNSPYGSCSSLPGTSAKAPERVSLDRKSVSSGDLSTPDSQHRSRGPLPSCLRRDPQYSGGERPSSSGVQHVSNSNNGPINHEEYPVADDSASVSSASVRFDLDATDVRHYPRPEEVHAQEGWTNYFF